MDETAQLLSVIHENAAQLEGNGADDFLDQSIAEIKKGEVRLQEQFAQVRDMSPPLDEITLHDLRSPLNLIMGFAEVLLDEVEAALDPALRERLHVILKAAVDLSVYIDEHLDSHSPYIR
jgi:signal transduction histidine kinase